MPGGSFTNAFACLSVSLDEEQPVFENSSNGRRAAKKRLRASQHRGEQTLYSDPGELHGSSSRPGSGGKSMPAAETTDCQNATRNSPTPRGAWQRLQAVPSCPAPAFPTPASSACDTLSEYSAAEALPEEHSLYHDDCCFYTMYMTDDHHLVACDELGHDIFYFEVASEADACDPAFQQQAHEIVRSVLQHQQQQAMEQHVRAQQAAGAGARVQGPRSRHVSPSAMSMLSSTASDVSAATALGSVPEWDAGLGASSDWWDTALEGEWAPPAPASPAAAGFAAAAPAADAVAAPAPGFLGGKWNTLDRPGSSSSNARQAQRGPSSRGTRGAQADIAALPSPSEPASSASAGQGRRRRGASLVLAPTKKAGVRVLNCGCQPSETASGWEEWGSGEAAWDAYSAHLELEASGLRLQDDDLDATLLLYGDERVKQSVLARAVQQAQRESNSVDGPTPEDMRSMMAAVGACAPPSGAPQRPFTSMPHGDAVAGGAEGEGPQQAQQGSAAASEAEEEECAVAGVVGYGKKSLRKIVEEMKARGWRQMQNSGHQKFERVFPELGGWKQVYFTSSTPSDVRYIWAVRADLARLDRVAAEKRQELARVGPLAVRPWRCT